VPAVRGVRSCAAPGCVKRWGCVVLLLITVAKLEMYTHSMMLSRHCKKCPSYLCIRTYYKIQVVKMSDKVQLDGCICEANFRYNARMEEHANLSSDIQRYVK
jgi:predicted metal-binding protein